MKTVLFACVHNAGRSQMAAAFFHHLADMDKAGAVSAGTQPAVRVNPIVVEAMREVGIDLSWAQPRLLTPELAASADLLVTMGCGDACPAVPGLRREDWPLADPKGQPLERVRRIRDEIRERVRQLVNSSGWGAGNQKESAPEEGSQVVNNEEVRQAVKERYRSAALNVLSGGASCCGGGAKARCDPITSNLYEPEETWNLPEHAVQASLGCGNPTALAELRPGEVVLDLGSGGGIDVLLSARRVGPTGKAYGLDMTDEMLALARENRRQAGVENVEFLQGHIEDIPLPDDSVDVIISNCVINLSADKDRVFREAFRVLRPGGRLAISDIVVRGHVAAEIRKNVELWMGCIAGALEESEYRSKLANAGFTEVAVETTRVYRADDAREILAGAGIDADAIAPEVDGKFTSAFVRAVKPRK